MAAPSIEIKHFKEVREENNLTQAEFAEILGIKNSTADIERGRTKLSGKVIAELLSQFNINPLWIFGESGQKYLKVGQTDIMPKVVTVHPEADEENIVMVNQKAAAGYPHNVQDVEWYNQLPGFNLPLPEFRNASYRGFQIEGDSMLPNYSPGDWVMAKGIGSMQEVNNNRVYVVVMYDSVLIKKVQKLPDPSKILLVSLNEEYLPIEVKVTDIQELWQVNSKLTFNLDNPSQSGLFQQLQQSMEDLKQELRAFKAHREE